MQDRHLFCFGLGYSATTLAQELLQEGWRVSGTCRTLEKCETFRPHGIITHIFDTDLPLQNVWDLDTVTHVLISTPPTESGDPVLLQHREDLKNLPNLQWVGYLSTTGVYGDHQGNWVDETTPITPPDARTQRRADAEQAWLDSGLPVNIFRLSGIYGPGEKRNALDSLKRGEARCIDKPGQVFSRIHVEDIAAILRASIENGHTGEIYNCADNEPAPQAEVVTYAAKLLAVSPPPLIAFDQADLSPMAQSFYQSNRRVSNQKIKEQLGVSLSYPSYREGLESLYKHYR